MQASIPYEAIVGIRNAFAHMNDGAVRAAMETIRNLKLESAAPIFNEFVEDALQQSEPLTKKTLKKISETHLSRKKISGLSPNQQFWILAFMQLLGLLITWFQLIQAGKPIVIDPDQVARLNQPQINTTNIFQAMYPSEPVYYLVMRDCELIPKPGRIEKYSAEAAASINRQAEATQYNAGYQADVTRSAGQQDAGNLRAQGQRSAQLASIQAALTGQTAATSGAATTQRMIIQAAAGFQKSATGSEVARSIRETNIGASREVSNIVSGAKRDLHMNAGNTSAAKIDQGVSLVNAMIPPEVPVARGLVEIPKYDAITKRNRTANNATTEFSQEMVQNQETTANRVVYSSQQYQKEMNVAIDKQAGQQIAGVNAGAGEAIAGYRLRCGPSSWRRRAELQ